MARVFTIIGLCVLLLGCGRDGQRLQSINEDLYSHGVPGAPIANGDQLAQRLDAAHVPARCDPEWMTDHFSLFCMMPWGTIYDVSDP